MKIFTIIKDQSERVFDKNFRLVNGKELWKHLISELSSHDITINTDSSRLINKICKSEFPKVSIVKRREKHIQWETDPNIHTSPVQDMLFDFCRAQDPNQIVVLTHVTSLFLSLDTVKSAVSKLENDSSIKSIHSVEIIKDFTWLKKENGYIPINFDPEVVQRTQDLPELLVSKGAFFIARAKDILEQKKRLPDPVFYYPLKHIECIEIDTEADLNFSKTIKEKR